MQEVSGIRHDSMDLSENRQNVLLIQRMNVKGYKVDIYLANLRKAENLRNLRKKKERTRTKFFKNPFKFVKDLFAPKKKVER